MLKFAYKAWINRNFGPIFVEFVELELFLPGPSSVTISSTTLEMELVPFQFHQNWN